MAQEIDKGGISRLASGRVLREWEIVDPLRAGEPPGFYPTTVAGMLAGMAVLYLAGLLVSV